MHDNPALWHASREGTAVPVFIFSPREQEPWAPGGASAWWLHHSLASLDKQLRERGSKLLLRKGASARTLIEITQQHDIDHVTWNRRYEPHLQSRDRVVKEKLEDCGIHVEVFESQLLHDPGDVETTSGGPYHVYTPFWDRVTGDNYLNTSDPLPAPELGPERAPDPWPQRTSLSSLHLLPSARDGVQWARGIEKTWTPGEEGAWNRLEEAISQKVPDYKENRNRPDRDGTSRLSPHLHHGEISPRSIWHALENTSFEKETLEPFLKQLVWREFSYHWLHHYPDVPSQTYRNKFKEFPWTYDEETFHRWKPGQTGYPIVDAGMRQLWETGWMHNRVRMIVASFLTKDLLIHWKKGARYFWDTLVDANLANNTMGWQWTAGCGVDPQPFFRIFHPVSQGERHDPKGAYIEKWVPELRHLPKEHLHAPWKASTSTLDQAGITLGETYPDRIVEHARARERALSLYESVK